MGQDTNNQHAGYDVRGAAQKWVLYLFGILSRWTACLIGSIALLLSVFRVSAQINSLSHLRLQPRLPRV